MSKADEAAACFTKEFSCSQSVFSTFAEECGIDFETALKVAGGFGGGMGRMGEVCGALTGAFMVIGMKKSEGKAETGESKERTYEIVQDIAARFKSRNGAVLCRELLGCDISTHEGHEAAKAQNLFATRCSGYVRDAAEILEEIWIIYKPKSAQVSGKTASH